MLGDYAYIVTGPTPIYSHDFFENCANLEYIARFGIGYDNIDIKAANGQGVLVSNIPAAVEKEDVAELALTLLLSMARKIGVSQNAVIQGEWSVERKRFLGTRIHGKTVGVIGFGNIGRTFARLLHCGFECELLVYDPYLDEEDIAKYGGIKVELKTLLIQSDIISLHMNLTEETKHIINEDTLKIMKKSAILLNSARGQLVDEKALYKALSHDRIGGYCADVTSDEPMSVNHELLSLGNVIITPHIGANTVECNFGMCSCFVNDLIRFNRGGVPLSVIGERIGDEH